MRGQHQPRIRPHDADRAPWRSPLAAPLLVAAFTTLVFLPSVRCGFVNWDDGEYANNALVLAGLSAESIHDAFTKVFYTDWAPVTRLSFLADATLFGGAPWGFHLTNVLLHAATAGIVLAALTAMTGHPGRSLAAALLFAVHPLRVESVAWISERKDVLSMLFLALALVAYEWYARRPSPARYAAVAAAMLGSLMSKATLVTLPVLLLVLDVWPLERAGPVPDRAATYPQRSWRQLVVEKLPLFTLSLVFSVLTVATWHDTATLWSRVLEYEPASDTAAEALVQHHAALGDVERALTIAEQIALAHAGTTAFMAIAEVQDGSGDFAATVETCRREAAAKLRHHGPDSRATLEAMVRHLTSLRNAGSPEAESLARELEPTLRRVLGLGHMSTLRTLVVIAGAANRAGDPTTAERYAREVLEVVSHTVEPVPEIRKPATIALAESLDRQGSTAAAGSLLERAIAEHGGLDGDAAVTNSQLAVALAAHLARTGHVAEARAFLEPLAVRIEAVAGERHPATLSVRRFLRTLASSAGADP